MVGAGLLTAVLHVVATPVGNLEDVTLRALRVFREADLVVGEDTRTTGFLLKSHGISKPTKSYRIHRLEEDTEHVLQRLREGKKIAFATDAGTPGVSDPGSHLVREVRRQLPEVPVVPIPGPSALTAALSVSGMRASPCLFLGFPSPKPGRRRRTLESHRDFTGAIVLFESVHRVRKTLLELREIFPDREILIAKEITKLHEEFRFLPDEVETWRGEFTLLVGPKM